MNMNQHKLLVNTTQEHIVGKCSNCTIEDLNYGKYGYFMSVSNCKKTPQGSLCDIYINVLDKRHECLSSSSIFACLYDNPTKILNNGNDITKNILRAKPTDPTIPPSIHPDGYIEDGRAIQSGEVSITLLQKLAKPCGEGLGDYYIDKLEPGCLPYSNTILKKGLIEEESAQVCYDGESTGLTTCCDNNMECTNSLTNKCNPCVSIIKNVPEEDVWKNDICYFYCPSYWQQRTQFLATDTQGGVLGDESQLCSDTYKTLCELAGCDPDPACKIKWGGCNYANIDYDICNGGDWGFSPLSGYTPINRCDLGSSYCEKNNLCTSQGTNPPRCTNDPVETTEILPIVVKRR